MERRERGKREMGRRKGGVKKMETYGKREMRIAEWGKTWPTGEWDESDMLDLRETRKRIRNYLLSKKCTFVR